jgi:SAM-dependent methyltransferase
MPAEDRKKRESDFHDKRFSAEIEPRQGLETVYRLMLPVNMRYHAILEGYAQAGRVLEYGCGKGDNALVFARRGVAITGIDISRSGVEHARAMAAKAGLEAEFQVMDGENLSFPTDTFEAVAGKGILHHLDLDRAMREIARVLKPEGRAIFIEPLGHNPLINWYRRRTPEARTPDERPLRAADLDKIRTFFPGAQFTFFNLTTLGALVFQSEKAFSQAFSLLQRLDAWLFQAFPWIGRYSWMVFMDLRRPVKHT